MFPEGRIFEFLIVGAVALMVVGPKDLPVLMRKVGRFVAHMRGLAAEFRASFEDMARQSELDELRREVEAMRSGQPLRDAVGLGAHETTQKVFDEIHSSLRDGAVGLGPTTATSSSHEAVAGEGGGEAPPVMTPLPETKAAP